MRVAIYNNMLAADNAAAELGFLNARVEPWHAFDLNKGIDQVTPFNDRCNDAAVRMKVTRLCIEFFTLHALLKQLDLE